MSIMQGISGPIDKESTICKPPHHPPLHAGGTDCAAPIVQQVGSVAAVGAMTGSQITSKFKLIRIFDVSRVHHLPSSTPT